MSAGPLGRVVFEVDGVACRWSDVVAAARCSGVWGRVEHRAAEGLGRLQAARRDGGGPPVVVVKARASEFRYAHNLLAADEMAAWLARWGITVAEWMDYLAGGLLLAATGEEVVGAEDPVGAHAVWVEAVCSGELGRLALRFAERLAIGGAGGVLPVSLPLGAVESGALERGFADFCAAVADEGSIEREVASHFLGWTRLDWRCLAWPEVEAAREAAMCVREDGMALDAVARGAGLGVRESSVLLEDADPSLAPVLTGAQPGILLGPLRVGEEFWVLEVDQRVAPRVSDPRVAARAARRVVERAVSREVAARVVWRERD